MLQPYVFQFYGTMVMTQIQIIVNFGVISSNEFNHVIRIKVGITFWYWILFIIWTHEFVFTFVTLVFESTTFKVSFCHTGQNQNVSFCSTNILWSETTLQAKKEVYGWWNIWSKSFKLCHDFGIYKSLFSFHDALLFLLNDSLREKIK